MLVARPATEADVPFVLSSFVHDAKRAPSMSYLERGQTRSLMCALLKNAEWNVTILADDGTPDEIFGFVVWRSPTEIAWIHTKGIYRGKGLRIASRLLAAIGAVPGPINVVFLSTGKFSKWARTKGWKLKHQPYGCLF